VKLCDHRPGVKPNKHPVLRDLKVGDFFSFVTDCDEESVKVFEVLPQGSKYLANGVSPRHVFIKRVRERPRSEETLIHHRDGSARVIPLEAELHVWRKGSK